MYRIKSKKIKETSITILCETATQDFIMSMAITSN
jgi:hypothetical protein